MERLIFHVDVNSAFLSWEATRRVSLGEEDIRLIPSAIGGDREKRTGVILAKSIPAKKFGIRTGEPVATALRKCPDLYLARPDFRLYEASSKAFIEICKQYAPVVEQVSIDECFLDMSGTHRIYPDPIAIATTIKDKIRDELGFTVNVGIGDCKLLAKMASDFEKPDKVHTLFRHEIARKMWPMRVGELFSVGHSTAEKLEKAKINTIGDLANTEVTRVQRIVGMKMGKQIYDYANGIDPSPVLAAPEEANLSEEMISLSCRFGRYMIPNPYLKPAEAVSGPRCRQASSGSHTGSKDCSLSDPVCPPPPSHPARAISWHRVWYRHSSGSHRA